MAQFPTVPGQEELAKVLDGSTSCFTFRAVPYAEGVSTSSLPVFISAQDLAPLPASLPFISIADIPKLPSLNGGAGLSILDLPLFASLNRQPSEQQVSRSLPQQQQEQQQLQLEAPRSQPKPKEKEVKAKPAPPAPQPQALVQARAKPSTARTPEPADERKAEMKAEEEQGEGSDMSEDDSQGTADEGSNHSDPGKRGSNRSGGKSKSGALGVGKRGVKKDRADRKRTLNREAQRRFRDRQKAALGELEERNLKQQQEIDQLKVSNKILQENYLALLENYKVMQAKVLNLQLRTGVVLV